MGKCPMLGESEGQVDPSETWAYPSSVALHPLALRAAASLVLIGCVHTRCTDTRTSRGGHSIKKGQQRSREKGCSLGRGLGDAG